MKGPGIAMLGFATDELVTVKVRSIDTAAKLALPDCVARSVQAPAATKVTTVSLVVQMVGVNDENVTANPDDAVACGWNWGCSSDCAVGWGNNNV